MIIPTKNRMMMMQMMIRVMMNYVLYPFQESFSNLSHQDDGKVILEGSEE